MRYNKEKHWSGARKKTRHLSASSAEYLCWWASSCLPSVSSSIPAGHTFKAEATPVQAVILAMRGANHESLGTPVVEYTVGGKTYTSTLNLSSSSMHPGKQITVYYRNGNPQEVRYLDDNNWIIGLLMAMAFVFAGMGLLLFW